jgi:hypothetical protein
MGYTDTSRGTVAGALRGGGFSYALLDSSHATNGTTKAIPTLGAGVATTSSHSVDGTAQIAWGGGASGMGTSVNLQCTSCHDPHGNGNFRILRPTPTGGTANAFPSASISGFVLDHTTVSSSGKTSYYYKLTTAAANTFKVTMPVTIYGSTGADSIIAATVDSVADSSNFIVKASVNIASSTGGKVFYADPLTVMGVTTTGTAVTYYMANVTGLVLTQPVTTTGFTPTGYNLSKAPITALPTTNSFTVANTNTAAVTVYGVMNGIQDALGTKVYTTSNYWAADDHNYSGTYVASGSAPTAYIANISQFCTQCHTRLLAGSGSYQNSSGDQTFMYMHRSNNGKESSPNCIQCHVAHGSNAQMPGANSSTIKNPDGSGSGSSFLLRVDNRGTCVMCHTTL